MPRALLPIAGLFAFVLWMGNAAYEHLSVSLIQMLKVCCLEAARKGPRAFKKTFSSSQAASPVSVFLIGVALSIEHFTGLMFGVICIISTGVAAAAVGDVEFDAAGVFFQLAAILCEAFRLSLLHLLLHSRGIKLNPLRTMYLIAPASFLCLLPVFLLVEAAKVLKLVQLGALPLQAMLLISISTLCAFGECGVSQSVTRCDNSLLVSLVACDAL